jgi:phosphoserine phosphatase RsbU/P
VNVELEERNPRGGKAVGFDLDEATLRSLREALPGWKIEALNGATAVSLTHDWNPTEVDFLVVQSRAEVAETLRLCRYLVLCRDLSEAAGLHVRRQTQPLRAKAPLLVLVPPGQESLMRGAFEAGADSCLVLPVRAKEVAHLLSRARPGVPPRRRHSRKLDRARLRAGGAMTTVGGGSVILAARNGLPEMGKLRGIESNSAGADEAPAPSSRPGAGLEPRAPSPIPWHRAQQVLLEMTVHLRRAAENAGPEQAALCFLVEQLPATLEALRQAHEEQVGQVAESNALLRKQLAEIAQAKQRLAAEHAVARVLGESTRLTDAAPTILQGISQSLGWDVGVLWTLDRDAAVLRCVDVWHAPQVAIPAFEQACRQHPCLPGIGLPGRVWASEGTVWIPDVTADTNSALAPLAAGEGLHTAVGFPIRNAEFLGVMAFFSMEIRQADEELLRMMTSVSSQVGQFIERMKAEKALSLQEAQLSVARKIQQGLVAQAPPTLAGFDVAGTSHCAIETGGDYFDFFPLSDSGQGIVIADASGHGLGPALVITATRAYLRALALTEGDIGRVLTLVNGRLAEDVGDDYFVTLILARLDPATRRLFYTSAGHPRGCVFDSSGSVKALLESTAPPLGIFPDGAFPVAAPVTLQPGDLVLLLTDGVLEARAPDDTLFGFQRAIDVVRVYRSDTAARIVDNLYHAVRAFSHNSPQVDDITAVVIKVREAS